MRDHDTTTTRLLGVLGLLGIETVQRLLYSSENANEHAQSSKVKRSEVTAVLHVSQGEGER